MKGSTQQCLLDFLHDGFEVNKAQLVADFVRVDVETIKRWQAKKQGAVGESLIRLRYFLESKGYSVAELESLDERVRNVGRLYGLRFFDLERLVEELDYTRGQNGRDQVLAVLRGVRGLSNPRFQILETLYKKYEYLLKPKTTTLIRPQLRTISESHATIIEALVASVQTMLPLAEHVVSEAFTAKERERIREVTKGGVSRLSLLLTKLSGEAARSALTKQQ